MATIIPYLKTSLSQRGLSSFIAASDESWYDLAITTWVGLGSSVQSQVTRINVHGYQYGGGRRDVLWTLANAAKKRLWLSEYGEGDGSGAQLFSNLLLDLVWLHPTAWVYWQAIDIPGWGLIGGDNDQLTLSGASTKYFVLAQFTRHIRPGMQILTTLDGNTAAAYDASSQKLVIVAGNWNTSQPSLSTLTQPRLLAAMDQQFLDGVLKQEVEISIRAIRISRSITDSFLYLSPLDRCRRLRLAALY
ncbi:hypothetical protein TGAMA5MH_02216 [Trichoderma gamsii]|uniref:Uncharacterized protein n=1 Tax=Trichoderma gamsii TaxID=398673 RepID=A0A2K0TKY8_9HYPO|nr:hypothetical protein TGAMA5MH_02216 [Trichoderma gamsii]